LGAQKAFFNARLFDGHQRHQTMALLVSAGRVDAVVPEAVIPQEAMRIDCKGQLLAPGFVDLQVNGGGGVLFNDETNVDGIRAICAAHARFGTTALLPTLITDTQEKWQAALVAARASQNEKVPGFLGLHLEGPFLAPSRKGAHRPEWMRSMSAADVAALKAAGISVLLLTVAAEQVSAAQVAELSGAGIIISLGHSDTTTEVALRLADHGASMVTHLYNAMSPLTHRAPGLVGAALDDGRFYAGLIADGHHVDPAAIRVALRAKQGLGRIFLVTDAMSTVGSSLSQFVLHGRTILRQKGRLTLEDGTLAGVDCDMAAMVRFMKDKVGVPLEEALRMASLYPAEAVGQAQERGSLRPGYRADCVLLDGSLNPVATYIAGEKVA
jgi:N-acetylglucosamine-6-phosphate deacetylase